MSQFPELMLNCHESLLITRLGYGVKFEGLSIWQQAHYGWPGTAESNINHSMNLQMSLLRGGSYI